VNDSIRIWKVSVVFFFKETILSCSSIFISHSILLQPFTDNKISPQLPLPRPDLNLHSPSEFLRLNVLYTMNGLYAYENRFTERSKSR
jgi:hypothetical protein